MAITLLWLVWFTMADVNSMNLAPATQSAISGSLVTFTITWTNGTGDAYLKYILPTTATYNIMYQNATLTPINNALLSLGSEHDPLFLIPTNSNFSVTITAKITTTMRTFPTLTTTWIFAADMQMSTILTSAIAEITPIGDLMITNVLTWTNPIYSGDNVSYYITLQNIWSTFATWITFISTFPIPTLSTPTATFNSIPYIYNYINYPQDFVWSGNYLSNLNAGDTITILLHATMTQAFPVGTPFNQIAKTSTVTPEYTTGNNTATATGVVAWLPDLRITKTFVQPRPSLSWDKAIFVITYGNSGYTAAQNVMLDDTVSSQIARLAFGPLGSGQGSASLSLWTIPVGSGGTITMTWYLNSFYLSPGTIITNTAHIYISWTNQEITTGNNFAFVSGWVVSKPQIAIDIFANNTTRPQMDTPPYGSWSQIMIQAVSGDTVKLTMNYINTGNTVCTSGIVSLVGLTGFISFTPFNSTIGNIQPGTSGTLIVNGIVWPKNFISFTPKATISCGEWLLAVTSTDQVKINEPLVCGDGLITQTEQCDTLWNLGVLFSGQVCENQQWVCVLRTDTIINNACINYQYINQLGWITTGQACSSVTLPLLNASCTSMTWSAPVINGNWYGVNLTCKWANTTTTTPIHIDCGNGTSISWSGAMFNGVCNYAGGFIGSAQCTVGNNTNPSLCKVPVSINAGNCWSLNALNGTVALVDENGNAESTFTCQTVNGTTAQTMTITCGNGTQHTANNVSILEAWCEYTNVVNTPQTYNVQCVVDGVSAPVCQQNLIVDEWRLSYCGNGIREWYENCDDGNRNWTPWDSCTLWCDIKWSAMVWCFNIWNTSISIEKWEILPFRWTLDQTNNIRQWNTCNNLSDGTIPEDTIMCTFDIYNGEQTEADWNPVYSIIKKCNTDTRQNAPIFNYFLHQWWRSLTHAFGKFDMNSNDFVNNVFGEYKIVLDKVAYKYCLWNNQEVGTEIDRVCSVDFAVTQPYLAQKSSFGLTPKATTVPLDGYKMINGDDLIDSTDLNNIMVLNESTYNWWNTITTMMNSFINKYSKLAIKYGTELSDDNTTITIYKVPGQDIVVLKGVGTLTYTEPANTTQPFTVIVDGPSIKINWSIENTNAMFLVNKWNITFLPSADVCTKTQVDKWIFVTSQWSFLAGPDLTNTNTNKEWCMYGWLKIQWILIGNGIQDLVQSRRSQLNGWFYVWWSSDAAIKAERRNEIFNGASVLIEYSPSLWSALPPGASEFTKALDVYKQ